MPAWLQRVVEFRAKVLFAEGRRPAQLAAQPDPRDLLAHHLVLEDPQDRVLGAWRLLPLTASAPGLCVSTYGASLHEALERRAVRLGDAGEGGGWAIDPSLRGRRLGLRLWAGGAALARSLGYAVVVAAIGTRDGQAAAIEACGGELLWELGTPYDPDLDDELVLGVHTLGRERPWFRVAVEEMAEELRLDVSRSKELHRG